jgi:hypothetical protein
MVYRHVPPGGGRKEVDRLTLLGSIATISTHSIKILALVCRTKILGLADTDVVQTGRPYGSGVKPVHGIDKNRTA